MKKYSNFSDQQAASIQQVRDRILNQTILIMAVLSIPTVIISVNRSRTIGWQPIMAVQIGAAVVIIGLAFFRKKASYTLRSLVILAELVILGGAGVYNLGLISNFTFLFVFIVYVTVLYGSKPGVISVFGVVMLLAVFAVLITQKTIVFSYDLESYITSTSIWFSRIFSVAVFSVMIVLAVGQLYDSLVSRIDRLEIEIEKRNQIQAELEEYRDHLELLVGERTEELEAFAYSVSHDLRAPLRTISGFGQILLEGNQEKLDEEGLDSLNRIEDATLKMDAMITGLLELSRISKKEMQPELVNLSEIANDIVRDLAVNEADREVEMSITEDLYARGDANLIRILLQNLLNNAWKFSKEKESAHIKFGLIEENGERIFFVQDNGVGFDSLNADKLFSPFQRLHSSSDFQGYGIGLATTEKIVKRHGGKIWAEAEIDKGATIFFTLSD